MVEVVLVLCRNRREFMEWCDGEGYDLATDHSPVGARGDESIAVRVIKLKDIEGFVGDRIEVLDGFEARPDADLVARYARTRLRTPGDD